MIILIKNFTNIHLLQFYSSLIPLTDGQTEKQDKPRQRC